MNTYSVSSGGGLAPKFVGPSMLNDIYFTAATVVSLDWSDTTQALYWPARVQQLLGAPFQYATTAVSGW